MHETLLTFIAASALLSVAPGPDNLFVLTQSALYGPRAGLLITLGLCTGLLVHTAAVALGVAAVFMVSAAAFTALKLLGAAWLLYLAWSAWRAPAAEPGVQASALRGAALYRRGIIMNLSNPKVALFFLAFLPQFADPARGAVPVQLMLLGAVFILVALAVFALIAGLAGLIARRLRESPRARLALNRLAALVFAGLALRLAAAGR